MTTNNEQVVTAQPQESPKMPPYGMDYRTWFEFKAKLAEKKSKVMAAVDNIPKNGYNEEHGYYFAKDADINDALRKLLNQHKLDFDIEFLNRVPKGNIMEVMLLMTWTDAETGYFESRKWMAAGFDTVDKGIYKAYTGGAKYYLMRTFLMSQGDTDPEYTEKGKKKPEPQPPKTNARNVKKEDEAPREVQEAAEPQEIKEEANTPEIKENAAEGQPEAADNEPKPDEQPEPEREGVQPITSEQVGKIKSRVLILAAFANDKNKKAAQDASYAALAIKHELLDWAARIKGVTNHGKMIEAFTSTEADKAIEYLDAWIAQKEAKANKGGK